MAGGKFSLHDLWAKLGIRWDGIKVGENAGMMSLNEPFTPAGEARMNALMDHIYNNFIKRVAEGRKMDIEDVEMIARGRVWSGRQARANGLVDQLGGLDEALDYTAQQLGAKDRHAMPLVILPRPQTPVERLAAFVEGQVSMGYSFHVLSHTLRLMTGAGIYDPVLVH